MEERELYEKLKDPCKVICYRINIYPVSKAKMKKRGRVSTYKPEYAEQARKLCEFGLTDYECAQFFDLSMSGFDKWKRLHVDLVKALKIGKEHADERVKRSLYTRAVGYNYEATKIFMPANREKPVYAKYIEHVPPDTTAGIFWLKNRDPQHWRDSQQLEHVLGKYIISDQPMTEEQWARERATVIDDEATPLLPNDEAASKKPNKINGS